MPTRNVASISDGSEQQPLRRGEHAGRSADDHEIARRHV
jgi:hypothetical protein